jgi:hypothetical protein
LLVFSEIMICAFYSYLYNTLYNFTIAIADSY